MTSLNEMKTLRLIIEKYNDESSKVAAVIKVEFHLLSLYCYV